MLTATKLITALRSLGGWQMPCALAASTNAICVPAKGLDSVASDKPTALHYVLASDTVGGPPT